MLCIFAVDLDILIRVALVVEPADGAVGADVGVLAVLQLAVEGELCREASQLLVVEQLPETDFLCLELATEDFLLIHVEL